jgi:hypothetical protein
LPATRSNTTYSFSTTLSQARNSASWTQQQVIMVAATRRQRARAASNTGEQALLVLRKSGWMASPDDARSEAVCRAAALADDTYGLVCTAEGRLTIDAATAQRLALAISTEPPPLSDTDDFFSCRARNAAGRACGAARVIMRYAKEGACDSAYVLLEAGFVPAAIEVYRRSVSVALSDETSDVERIEAFKLAWSAANALESLANGVRQARPETNDAFQTTRDDVCGEYTTLGVLETVSAVLAASKLSDSPMLRGCRVGTLDLASTTFLGLRDLSVVEASLVRDIGSYVGDSDGQVASLALLALYFITMMQNDVNNEALKSLTDAALEAFCEPTLVEAIAHVISRGCVVSGGFIIEVLAAKAPSHAHAFAKPSVVGALLEVISLDSDEARMAYEKQHKYGSQARSESHTGFVAAGSDNPGVHHDRKIDELSAVALLAILKTGAVAASPELGAAIVVPILDKLRASFVDPTPGPELYEIRCVCLGILEALAPLHAKEIMEAGGIDVAIDLLKQLKLPGSTAVRRLTEMCARNPCAFLKQLIAAGPAYADAVRLELKEFTNHPEFNTFLTYANRGTLDWFALQLHNAPGGPPAWLQA